MEAINSFLQDPIMEIGIEMVAILRDLTKKIDIKVEAVVDTQRDPTTNQVLLGDTMMIIEATTIDLIIITSNTHHHMIGPDTIMIALKLIDLTTEEEVLIGMVETDKVVIGKAEIDLRVQFAAIIAKVRVTLQEIAKKKGKREEMEEASEAEVASGVAVMAAVLMEVEMISTTEIEIEEALMIDKEEVLIPTLEALDGQISPEVGIRTTRKRLKEVIGMKQTVTARLLWLIKKMLDGQKSQVNLLSNLIVRN